MSNIFSNPGWDLLKGSIEVNPFSLLVNVASENLSLLKPFLTNVLILYLLAIPKIQMFSGFLKVHKIKTLAWKNGLILGNSSILWEKLFQVSTVFCRGK